VPIPTLVLLPGLDGTGELFADFVSALDGIRTRVISYPADRAMDYAQHEAFARAKLPADEDYVLLAESFSGPVGIAIAASRPPRLKGFILCVSFAANPLPLFSPFSRLLTALPAIRMPPALAAPWLYAGRATPELRRAHAAAMARVSPRVLAARRRDPVGGPAAPARACRRADVVPARDGGPAGLPGGGPRDSRSAARNATGRVRCASLPAADRTCCLRGDDAPVHGTLPGLTVAAPANS